MFIIDDIFVIAGSTLLGAAIGGAVGGATGAIVSFLLDIFLDEGTLSNEVHIRYPDALKLLIEERKKNAVKVGIFGEDEIVIESGVEISSSEGVSDNLHVGQVIYL